MADKHPYSPATSHLVQTITQFRKSFPPKIAAETLKKLGIARQNESRVLNVFRFLKIIDEEGNKTALASKVFSLHDAAFSEGFGKIVKDAYKDLFDLHGEDAWSLDTNELITFFRQSDQTTAIVGSRQAATFQVLAAFSGHGEISAPKANTPKAVAAKKTAAKKTKPAPAGIVPLSATQPEIDKRNAVGLTVRIEINLPSDGDQDTYNRIFKSIRENLLNG